MLRYLWSAPISFALNLFVWVFADIIALEAAFGNKANLGGWRWYFQTHDDWVYGFGAEKPTPPAKWWSRWRIAAWWLRRNPCYAFDAFILGFPAKPDAPKWAEETAFGMTRFESADGVALWSYRTHKVWFGWKRNAPTGRHMLVVHVSL